MSIIKAQRQGEDCRILHVELGGREGGALLPVERAPGFEANSV